MTLSSFDVQQVQLQVIPINQVISSPELLKIARRMTLDAWSGMNKALNMYELYAPTRTIDATAIFAVYHQEYIGWCMLTAEGDGLCFWARDNYLCTHTFVRPDYRRLKVGTKLMDKALELASQRKVKVYSGNEPLFFRPYLERYANVECV
jgi:GNAT superfamily N-acetyltransferase